MNGPGRLAVGQRMMAWAWACDADIPAYTAADIGEAADMDGHTVAAVGEESMMEVHTVTVSCSVDCKVTERRAN